jgi:hypothetical protein
MWYGRARNRPRCFFSHKWTVTNVDAANFFTIEQCRDCGVKRQRGMLPADVGRLDAARSKALRDNQIEKLKRELRFEKAKPFLQKDRVRIFDIIRTINALSSAARH